MPKISGKFTELNDYDGNLKNGRLIVEDTLFIFRKGHVDESYDLKGKNFEEKVKDARKQAELSNRATIIVDTEGVYDEDTINDYGKLITADEAFDELDEEEQDGWDDIIENINR